MMEDHRDDDDREEGGEEESGEDTAADVLDARTVRGSGGARLQEAARALLTGATLDDLTTFVTVRRLSETSGLSSGAVYASFGPEAADGSRQRTAPQVVAREAFRSLGVEVDIATLQARAVLVEQLASLGSDDPAQWMRRLAGVLAESVAADARGEVDDGWSYTQEWLGAAVSLNDAEIAAFLRKYLDSFDRAYAAVLADLLAATGRELVDGIDLHEFARMFVVAGDGCALRLRVDPDLDPGIISSIFLSLMDSMTRRVGTRDDLPGHRLTIEGQDPLCEEEQEAVRTAVLRVSSRAGWPAVTLTKVSQLSGIPDGRLAGVHPSRHDLAAIVWDDLVSGIEHRDAARDGLSPAARLSAFVDDACDTVCSQRSLASSMLISRLNATSQAGEPREDPGSSRFVEAFASVISAAVDAEGPERSDGRVPVAAGDGFRVMARATLDLILLRASVSTTSGPELTSLVIDGMAGSGVIAEPSR